MDGMNDEYHWLDFGNGKISCWQLRNSIDRRFWMTSGGWSQAIGYGIVDDFGDIVRTPMRPLGIDCALGYEVVCNGLLEPSIG